MRGLFVAIIVATAVVFAASCTAGAAHPATSPAPLPPDQSVSPGGPRGAWLVHYEIGGQQLTDYWFYIHRRWMFDLVLSNPGAVKLYRMSKQQYVAALGCAH